MDKPDLVVVGRVAKAHGILGELAVDVRTDTPRLRFALEATVTARLRDGTHHQLTVSAARQHAGRLLVRFTEVPDRDAAEAMRGALLLASTADLPPIDDPDEFYDHQLEGLTAELLDGTVVGVVREISHGAGGETLVIDRDSDEVLVPFVREIVPTVDIAGGRVVLDPPEGLIE
ncbi:ribosome maturation factor RimM [Actinokineospora terrae]|uniref:Ribosome maturation factor RimM n=1 Tax=Actinokineospora terrae TaxID=155974 RepID=A0A1H9QAE5_9PSEU|nr:ribosome maturation factor RimM [Actinokineospora terrae]SER57526.1 16S rRNA processing protein RimM [Actinokineospora terrae]